MQKNSPLSSGAPLGRREEEDLIRFPAAAPVRFGALLKASRLRCRLSQEDLAARLGVTRFTVMNWESDRSRPDYDLLPRLCDVLKLSLPELFGVKSGLSPLEQSVLRELRFLKPGTQRLVKQLILSLAEKELAAHEEALLNSTRVVDLQPGSLSAGTAASGRAMPDLQPSPFFLRISERTRRADAVIRVSGRSMEPAYHPEDQVFFEYASAARPGEDVVVCWAGQAFIKRLAPDGTLYSLNPDYPFVYEGDGEDIRLLGRVLGVLAPEDLPAGEDLPILQDLFREELAAYGQAHGDP